MKGLRSDAGRIKFRYEPYFARVMPAKKLGGDYRKQRPEMLRETCVAELIHSALCITGFYCLVIWPDWKAFLLVLVYDLFLNLPFVMIQRYNRPRLMRLCRYITENGFDVVICPHVFSATMLTDEVKKYGLKAARRAPQFSKR